MKHPDNSSSPLESGTHASNGVEPLAKLTAGSLLTRNVILNLVGQGVPLVVALFAIPVLVRGLGTDRFGVLTIAWMVIGYFSLFDFGIGRALTKLVAEKLGVAQHSEIAPLVWTAMLMMGLLGALGALSVALLTPWLVGSVLNIPAVLQEETRLAFYLLAVAVPIVISTAGLRGVLEALQCFGIINALRIPLGAFMFLGPLLILPFSQSLFPVVGVLVFARVVAWLLHGWYCVRVMPTLRKSQVRRAMVSPLFRFGAWMTVSNVVSPLMVYVDRFLIGSVLTVAAVAYYTAPYEIITKLLVVPSALVGVLFPAFSVGLAATPERVPALFGRGIKYVMLALFPPVVLAVTFAHETLNWWLSPEFASHSTSVMQWLAIGILANGVAHIPFSLLQGAGRPDLTAKLHIVELPIYLTLVWVLMKNFGINGVAMAWVLRATADVAMLSIAVRLILPATSKTVHLSGLVLAAMLVVLCAGMVPMSLSAKTAYAGLVLCVFVVTTWKLGLDISERHFICCLARKYGL